MIFVNQNIDQTPDLENLDYKIDQSIGTRDFLIIIGMISNSDIDLVTISTADLLEAHKINVSQKQHGVIFINAESSQSTVRFSPESLENKRIANEINHAIIQANLNQDQNLSLSQILSLSANELIKLFDHHNTKKIVSANSEDQYSNEFSNLTILLFIISISYITLMVIKQRKKGKDIEDNSFNSFGRIKEKYHSTLVIFTIILLALASLNFIYYIDEVIWLIMILLIASKPVTNCVLSLFFYAKDFIGSQILKNKGKNKTFKPRVVPLKILLDPNTSNFELLELTYHSLLFQEQIHAHEEWKEFRDGNSKKYIHIEKGKLFNPAKAKAYEHPFLQPFIDLDDDLGYYLHTYIGLVHKNINGIKAFKKDLLSKELIQAGLLKRNLWAINIYRLTEKGVLAAKRTKALIDEKTKKLMDPNLPERDLLVYMQKGPEILLLVDDFSSQIYDKLEANRIISLRQDSSPAIRLFLPEETEAKYFENAFDIFHKPKKYVQEDYN